MIINETGLAVNETASGRILSMSRRQADPNYDFGGYDDEYRGFEMRDDDTGRGPLILLLALGVLLIFAGVVWNTYRQGIRPASGGLPVIGADAAPFKRAPEERGGQQVAGQDAGFYGLMEDKADETAPRQAAMQNPLPLRRGTDTLAGAPPAESEPERKTGPVLGVRKTVLAEGLDVREAPEPAQEPVQVAALTPTPLPEAPKVVSEPLPAPKTVTSRFVANGSYEVQLLASRSETNAQFAWDRLKAESPNLYSGARLNIQKADLGAKGIFYRLRVGTFNSRANAKSFCEDVKKSGKDCIVVSKAS